MKTIYHDSRIKERVCLQRQEIISPWWLDVYTLGVGFLINLFKKKKKEEQIQPCEDRRDKEKKRQLPVHSLGALPCFGCLSSEIASQDCKDYKGGALLAGSYFTTE